MNELVGFILSLNLPAWVYFVLAGFFAFLSGVAFSNLIKKFC